LVLVGWSKFSVLFVSSEFSFDLTDSATSWLGLAVSITLTGCSSLATSLIIWGGWVDGEWVNVFVWVNGLA